MHLVQWISIIADLDSLDICMKCSNVRSRYEHIDGNIHRSLYISIHTRNSRHPSAYIQSPLFTSPAQPISLIIHFSLPAYVHRPSISKSVPHLPT